MYMDNNNACRKVWLTNFVKKEMNWCNEKQIVSDFKEYLAELNDKRFMIKMHWKCSEKCTQRLLSLTKGM